MTKAERTRQFIIEKAAPIFNRKGIAGTSMSDIMEATKLAKGGIYGNFESKDEICLESYNYLSKWLNDQIDQDVDRETTAKGKLFAIMAFYEGRMLLKNYAGCPMLNFGTEVDDTNPQMKEKVSNSIDRFRARIIKVIKAGQENGELDGKLDPETFSTKMFAMIEGAILIRKVQNNPASMHLIMDLLKAEIEQHTI